MNEFQSIIGKCFQKACKVARFMQLNTAACFWLTKANSEEYLEPNRISMMKFFCQNS